MTKKEFINESNLEIIQKIIKNNNGYITVKELEGLGISRNYLSIMTKKNMIDKVAKGFYVGSDKIKDVYYVLSVSTPKIIYSHMTALYFHNLSIKAPDNSFDITVTKKYNNLKHVKYSIKEYLKRKDRDLIKLSKYADIFGIKEEVMDFVSMMYE